MSDRTKSTIELSIDQHRAESALDRLQKRANALEATLLNAGRSLVPGSTAARAAQADRQNSSPLGPERWGYAQVQTFRRNNALWHASQTSRARRAAHAVGGAVGDVYRSVRDAPQWEPLQTAGRGAYQFGRAMQPAAALTAAGVGGALGGAMYGSPSGMMSGITVATQGLTAMGTGLKGLGVMAAEIAEQGGGGAKSVLGMLGKTVPWLGEAVKAAGKIAGVAMGAMGVVSANRYQIAGTRATYELAGMRAQLSGAAFGPGSGIGLGLGPQEAAAAASEASMGAGFRGSMRGVNLFGLMRSGVSAGGIGGMAGMAAYRRGGAGESGSTQDYTRRVIAAGFMDGLRGSKLEQFAGVLGGAITGAANGGVRSNLDEVGTLAYNINKALDGQGRMIGARVAGGLISAPAQAKQALLAPFQQAAQGLMIAHAAKSGGGTFEGLLQGLEDMGPGGAMEALRSGGDVGRYYLAGQAPMSMVDRILGATPGATGSIGGVAGMTAGVAAQAQAQTRANVLGTMDAASAAAMIEAMGKLQVTLQDISVRFNADDFLPKMADMIRGAIDAVFH